MKQIDSDRNASTASELVPSHNENDRAIAVAGRRKRALLLSLCLLTWGGFAVLNLPAQWVAYNDHYRGPETALNATAWNVFSTVGGAPGNSGPLKNITTGADLPVVLTITNYAATGSIPGAARPPARRPTTRFMAILISAVRQQQWHQHLFQSVMAHIFTGLNPNKRYSFKGTAAWKFRDYTNRWILVELDGADSFTSAHTKGVLTSNDVCAIEPNQAALRAATTVIRTRATRWIGKTLLRPATARSSFILANTQAKCRAGVLRPITPTAW